MIQNVIQIQLGGRRKLLPPFDTFGQEAVSIRLHFKEFW